MVIHCRSEPTIPGGVRNVNTYSRSSFSVGKAFNITLANALVHYLPPKHHARALSIINDILATDPDNIRSLMGRAYILQAAKQWSDAGALFARVAELIPEDLDEGIRAKEECAWCLSQAHDPEGGATVLKAILDTLDQLEGREADQARCWWRLGKCYWNMGGTLNTSGFAYLVILTVISYDIYRWVARRSIPTFYHGSKAVPDVCSCIHIPWDLLRGFCFTT